VLIPFGKAARREPKQANVDQERAWVFAPMIEQPGKAHQVHDKSMADGVHRNLQFDPFELSSSERVLRREGVALPLGSRALQVLLEDDERVFCRVGSHVNADGSALAVLPAGTGNLLATNLGLPLDPAEGVRVAVAGGRRQVDLGEVDGELFAVMAGMGFDAAVMDATSSKLKTRIGPLAYVLSAVPQLFGRPMRVRVLVDDEAPRRRHARAVLVGNVGRLQGGIRLLPDAEPDNGRMDVAIIAPRNLAHWAALALAVLLRREKVPRMEVLRGSRITISSDRAQPRELDGDVIDPGSTLEVIVRPGAFWLCVPQPDQAADLADS